MVGLGLVQLSLSNSIYSTFLTYLIWPENGTNQGTIFRSQK